MHEVENIQRAADNLSAAARELRRANVMIPRSIPKTIAATIGIMASLAGIVAVIVAYWPI